MWTGIESHSGDKAALQWPQGVLLAFFVPASYGQVVGLWSRVRTSTTTRETEQTLLEFVRSCWLTSCLSNSSLQSVNKYCVRSLQGARPVNMGCASSKPAEQEIIAPEDDYKKGSGLFHRPASASSVLQRDPEHGG